MRAWDGPAVKKRLRKRYDRDEHRLTIEEFDALVPRTVGAREALRRRVDEIYAMVKQRRKR